MLGLGVDDDQVARWSAQLAAEGTVTIPVSKSKLWLGSASLAGASVVGLVQFATSDGYVRLVGLALAVLLGSVLLLQLFLGLRRLPALVVNNNGIQTNGFTTTFIPWHEVRGVTRRDRGASSQFVYVDVSPEFAEITIDRSAGWASLESVERRAAGDAVRLPRGLRTNAATLERFLNDAVASRRTGSDSSD